jgi:hypothetical protein
MTTLPALPLRQVAKLLSQIRRLPAGEPAIVELLGLLKSGELKAGFEFPGSKVCWIAIPTSYWTRVNSYKFGSLRFISGDKRRTGTYEVRISEFIDEYMQVVRHDCQTMGLDPIPMLYEELSKALPAAPCAYEVLITSEEWMKYLERHQIPASAIQHHRSGGGRHPKTSWHHLAPIIGGYLMTLNDRPAESRDHNSIAANVLELATRDGISDLPATDTLRDVISKAFAKSTELLRP